MVLVRHLWGVDYPHGLEPYLARWRDVGYEALEGSLHFLPDREALLRFLKTSGWKWIPQVFSRDYIAGGSVREHLYSLKKQIDHCMEQQPWFFNAHSGSDTWSLSQPEDFYGAMLEMERRLGVAICHETHRSRYFGNPWITRPILEKFPDLNLTCDFSHWVCVAERLLEDCGEIIQLAPNHCHHLHARTHHRSSRHLRVSGPP